MMPAILKCGVAGVEYCSAAARKILQSPLNGDADQVKAAVKSNSKDSEGASRRITDYHSTQIIG
jgi:hypothetical protein